MRERGSFLLKKKQGCRGRGSRTVHLKDWLEIVMKSPKKGKVLDFAYLHNFNEDVQIMMPFHYMTPILLFIIFYTNL